MKTQQRPSRTGNSRQTENEEEKGRVEWRRTIKRTDFLAFNQMLNNCGRELVVVAGAVKNEESKEFYRRRSRQAAAVVVLLSDDDDIGEKQLCFVL